MNPETTKEILNQLNLAAETALPKIYEAIWYDGMLNVLSIVLAILLGIVAYKKSAKKVKDDDYTGAIIGSCMVGTISFFTFFIFSMGIVKLMFPEGYALYKLITFGCG